MKISRLGIILCLGAVCASAQLGGLLKSKSGSKSGVDSVAAIAQADDMLKLVTIATDNGVKAVELLASAFPAEKIQKLTELALKYNEMKAKRGDQNADAESLQLGSQIEAEMASLDSEWQAHVKEKSGVVKRVDARLALVILADGLAGKKAPEAAKALQSAAQDLKSDPTQLSKANRMMAMATMLTLVGKEAPKQLASLKTIRGTTKQIAEAEKIQLDPEPSPDSIKDSTTANQSMSSPRTTDLDND